MRPNELVQDWVAAFNCEDVDALLRFQRGYWAKLTFLRIQALLIPGDHS